MGRSVSSFTYFVVIVLMAAVLILLVAGSAEGATGTISIQNNGTGGECSSVGVWNQYSMTCTLTMDLSFSGSNGIEIISDGITLDGNGHTITGSGGYATGGSLSVRNGVTIKNLTVRNFGYGIYLVASHGNTIRNNTIEDNVVGLKMVVSNNNTVYGNSFINNGTQAVAQGGIGNIFNMPAPVGGNYWTNWAQPDSDSDGFVDNPYYFTGGVDNLPLAGVSSCNVGKPPIMLGVIGSYWQTLADYNVGRLSVDYALTNLGSTTALGSQITGSSNTNGVLTYSPMPVGVGDLSAGATLPFTIKYTVPPAVTNFNATLAATATDDCGNWYTYP